jgi:Domain of unknown function (DUF4159)
MTRGSRRVALIGSAVAVVVAAVVPPLLSAQGRNRQAQEFAENVPYDGRFTFARIRYSQGDDGGFRRDIKWAHDYPRGERHFTKILSELSTLRVRTQESNILALDDPELFKYPVAYLCEAGFWRPSDAEALGLRNYLLKGGFIIFDDFARNDWFNFEAQMRRVVPGLRAMRLTPQDKVFDSFYHIEDLTYFHPYYGMPSEFWGYYENNDRSQRLLAIVNYNNDLSEHWEFSDEGFFPLEASNEAYKLGVNYLIHALTR